ncbi:MAG: hypothetical protein V4736_11285 [Bdellovibrionota bacterium]
MKIVFYLVLTLLMPLISKAAPPSREELLSIIASGNCEYQGHAERLSPGNASVQGMEAVTKRGTAGLVEVSCDGKKTETYCSGFVQCRLPGLWKATYRINNVICKTANMGTQVVCPTASECISKVIKENALTFRSGMGSGAIDPGIKDVEIGNSPAGVTQ